MRIISIYLLCYTRITNDIKPFCRLLNETVTSAFITSTCLKNINSKRMDAAPHQFAWGPGVFSSRRSHKSPWALFRDPPQVLPIRNRSESSPQRWNTLNICHLNVARMMLEDIERALLKTTRSQQGFECRHDHS